MPSLVLTEEEFLKDVADHKMTALHDDGLYRSIRFAREGEHSWWNWFTLTTWPGYLCINGDMGCFVFSRITDMFEFFRTAPYKEQLYINLGYWHEKIEADDRRVGSEKYDEEKFKAIVGEIFNRHEFDSKQQKRECWEQIKNEVLRAENEYEAFNNAGQFHHKDSGFEFCDFWEHNLKSYTYQYQWCCYAIAWGIRQYDAAHKDAPALAEVPA